MSHYWQPEYFPANTTNPSEAIQIHLPPQSMFARIIFLAARRTQKMHNFTTKSNRAQLNIKPGKRITLFGLSLLFQIFVPIYDNWYFMWAHVFFIGWVFFLTFKSDIKRGVDILTPLCTITVFILYGLIHSTLDIGPRYYQDSVKVIIFIIGVALISSRVGMESLLYLTKKYITIFPFVFLGYFFFLKQDEWFQYSGRLYDPLFGSPNVLGAFCAAAIIFIVRFRNMFSILGYVLGGGFYLTILALGFSRASIIGLIVALALSGRRKVLTALCVVMFFSLLGALVIFQFGDVLPEWVFTKGNVAKDISETGGSNRIDIWIPAISNTLNNPMLFAFGGGPGRELDFTAFGLKITHPHNFYIFTFWAYGILGLLFFLLFWIRIGFRTIKSPAKSIHKSGLFAIFLYYTAIFFMDTHLLASQYLVPHIFLISIITVAAFDKNSSLRKNPTQSHHTPLSV